MSRVYKTLKPTTQHYHTVMEAYNKTKIQESPARSEKLLFEMINYSKLDHVQGQVIHNDNRNDDKEDDDIPSSTVSLYEYYVKPNKDTVNLALTVWAESGIKSSGLKAERLLLKVIDYYRNGFIDE